MIHVRFVTISSYLFEKTRNIWTVIRDVIFCYYLSNEAPILRVKVIILPTEHEAVIITIGSNYGGRTGHTLPSVNYTSVCY